MPFPRRRCIAVERERKHLTVGQFIVDRFQRSRVPVQQAAVDGADPQTRVIAGERGDGEPRKATNETASVRVRRRPEHRIFRCRSECVRSSSGNERGDLAELRVFGANLAESASVEGDDAFARGPDPQLVARANRPRTRRPTRSAARRKLGADAITRDQCAVRVVFVEPGWSGDEQMAVEHLRVAKTAGAPMNSSPAGSTGSMGRAVKRMTVAGGDARAGVAKNVLRAPESESGENGSGPGYDRKSQPQASPRHCFNDNGFVGREFTRMDANFDEAANERE